MARLDAGETRIADRHDRVAVLFSDLVGFTGIAARLAPADLVARLDELFSAFDAACAAHGVEKIKTIGDAYMAAAGLGPDEADPCGASAAVGLDMLRAVEASSTAWRIRIGLHVGPVVAGVIGRRKFAYDLWGDSVNIASRLEATAEPGRIHVSAEVADALARPLPVRVPRPRRTEGQRVGGDLLPAAAELRGYHPRAVLGGELAVPCTCNPLQQG